MVSHLSCNHELWFMMHGGAQTFGGMCVWRLATPQQTTINMNAERYPFVYPRYPCIGLYIYINIACSCTIYSPYSEWIWMNARIHNVWLMPLNKSNRHIIKVHSSYGGFACNRFSILYKLCGFCRVHWLNVRIALSMVPALLHSKWSSGIGNAINDI